MAQNAFHMDFILVFGTCFLTEVLSASQYFSFPVNELFNFKCQISLSLKN